MGDDLAQPHIPPTETNHKGAVLGRTKTTEPTGFTPGEQHPEQRPQQFGRYLEKMFLFVISFSCYSIKIVSISEHEQVV